MEKLIKLSDTHYIVVDDSEIKEKSTDWFYSFETNRIYDCKTYLSTVSCKKITHSTQPLEFEWDRGVKEKFFDKIRPLSLSEVEEAINGYDVEKIACEKANVSLEWYRDKTNKDRDESLVFYVDGLIEGFKAHQELTKDKLFTIEDMIRLAIHCWNIASRPTCGGIYNVNEIAEDFMKPLLPETEWDITFDKQGKIKLLWIKQ